MSLSQLQVAQLVAANILSQGGGIQPPPGFAFIRTLPGTQMVDQFRNPVVAPALSGQGIPA